MRKIDVSVRDLEQIRDILRKHLPDRKVAAFGSRVTGSAKPFSDLDLVVMGEQPIPTAALANLREELDESDLPFKVDLVEWASTASSFRKIIEQHAVPIEGSR